MMKYILVFLLFVFIISPVFAENIVQISSTLDSGGYIKATFIRSVSAMLLWLLLGVYAIRWSEDGVLWSEPTSVSIQKPGNPHSK